MKKFRVLLFILLISLSLTLVCEADEEPEISADYACVYNVESDTMLYAKGANTIIYPASLVKIMTASLAFDYLSEVGGDDFAVTVTASALETLAGNNIKLKEGETLSFRELLSAVVIGGANDAALVIAETVAGSVDAFVDMMNEKAASLGAENTQFANPTGYHSPYMYSTLSDLALICKWASSNSEYMALASTVKYTIPETNMSAPRNLSNSNLLLDPTHWLRHYKPGTSGMNSGSTAQAGYTLATVYDNDGQTNIVIIAGGKVDGWDYHYYNDASTLIDYTSVSYSYQSLVEKDLPVVDMSVLYGKETDHVLLTTSKEVVALLPNDYDPALVTTDYTLHSTNLVAPIKKGAEFGSYNVYYDGEPLSSIPLVTQNTVKRDYFAFIMGSISAFFEMEIVKSVIWLLISAFFFAIVITVVWIYTKRQRKLRREREERRRRLEHARRSITK